MSNLPLVGVSACLLGHKTRYDGNHKFSSLITDELGKHCTLLPICPEIEIGLGVPRERIQLINVGATTKALKSGSPSMDVSTALADIALQFVNQHSPSALVLQDKSPSCGIANTKLFSQTGEQIGVTHGLFAATIIDFFPSIVLMQKSQLQNKKDIECFLIKINDQIQLPENSDASGDLKVP